MLGGLGASCAGATRDSNGSAPAPAADFTKSRRPKSRRPSRMVRPFQGRPKLQYVARPPEMSNTAPVENAQSSDASHATIAASSSTSTKRRLRDLRQHEVDMLLRQLVEDRGLGRGRRHRVDEDVVLREFLAERFRQRDQAGLRGRIMRGVGVAFLAGDRGDVDDAAVFLFEHRRHHRLAADEGPVEIDAQHLAPFLEVGFPHRLVDAGDAGIVDEDVDLAERLQRLVAGLFDRGEIGDVDLEGGDPAPISFAVFSANGRS